jgi:plastocyanin
MITSAGALQYHCSIHPSMVGSLNGTASGGGGGGGY